MEFPHTLYFHVCGKTYPLTVEESDYCWILTLIGGPEETEYVGFFTEDVFFYAEEYKWRPGKPMAHPRFC